jgi:hypothetical protein
MTMELDIMMMGKNIYLKLLKVKMIDTAKTHLLKIQKQGKE